MKTCFLVIAVFALLLILPTGVAAQPHTINAPTVAPQDLDTLAPPYYLLITNTGEIHATGDDAIFGITNNGWTIDNYGKIYGNDPGWDGIYLESDFHLINNRDGAIVQGDYAGVCLYLSDGTRIYNYGDIAGDAGVEFDTTIGSSLVNYGAVYGFDAVTVFDGLSTNINNYGELAGFFDGIYLETSSNTTIVNHGGIYSFGVGVWAYLCDHTRVENHGLIIGDTGIAGDESTVDILNTGTIRGDLEGVVFYIAPGSRLINRGGIFSDWGVQVDTSPNSTVINSGTIEGGEYGICSFDSDNLAIYNSGTITGYTGVYIENGPGTSIVNAGTIEGTGGLAILLLTDEAAVELRNGARVIGNIQSIGSGNRFIVNAPGGSVDYAYHVFGFDNATIKAGTFKVDGSLSSRDVLVNGGAGLTGNGSVILAGGALRNFGTVGTRFVVLNSGTLYNWGLLKSPYIFGGTVQNHGLVAAGNSIGAMRIGGDYRQDADGTLEVEFDGLSSDQYTIQGRAYLSGALRVVPYNAPLRWTGTASYTFLTADGGVEGMFTYADIQDYYKAVLKYGANTVALSIGRRPYADRVNCPENLGLARALDNLYDTASGDLLGLTDTLDRRIWDGENICPLLGGLHPHGRGVLPRLTADDTRDRLSGFARRIMPDAPAGLRTTPEGWTADAWASGSFKQRLGRDDAAGFRGHTLGLNIALYRDMTEQSRLGLGIGAVRGNATIDASGRRHETSGGQAVVYGRQGIGDGWVTGALAWGRHSLTRRDRMEAGDWSRSADDTTGAWSLGALAESGYRFDLGAFRVRPGLGASYVALFEDASTTHGAGNAGFRYGERTWNSLRGRASLEAFRAWSLTGDRTLTPSLTVGWEHDFTPDQSAHTARFRAGGPTFGLAAGSWDTDVFRLGGGIRVGRQGKWAGYARYEAALYTDGCDHTFDAGVQWRF